MTFTFGDREAFYSKQAIAEVMQRHQRLTVYGFKLASHSGFLKQREALLRETEGFWAARFWLEPFQRTLSVSRNGGIRSRALKERPERKFGVYVPDGALIAAAVHLRFPIREEGPDVLVGVRRTVKFQHAFRHDFMCDPPWAAQVFKAGPSGRPATDGPSAPQNVASRYPQILTEHAEHNG